MKIKGYLQFIKEDLNSDYTDYCNNSEYKIGLSQLPYYLDDKLATEFKYRLSDGEDLKSLLQEFLKRTDNQRFSFNANIILQQLKPELDKESKDIINGIEGMVYLYKQNIEQFNKEILKVKDRVDYIFDDIDFTLKHYEEEIEDTKAMFPDKPTPISLEAKIKMLNAVKEHINSIISELG